MPDNNIPAGDFQMNAQNIKRTIDERSSWSIHKSELYKQNRMENFYRSAIYDAIIDYYECKEPEKDDINKFKIKINNA